MVVIVVIVIIIVIITNGLSQIPIVSLKISFDIGLRVPLKRLHLEFLSSSHQPSNFWGRDAAGLPGPLGQ